jgi:hypothetical protein
MSTDKPNPPKAAPTHEEARTLARAIIYADLRRPDLPLETVLSYIAASERKDVRIAELEREVNSLRCELCVLSDERILRTP